jgi:hypothetical protein
MIECNTYLVLAPYYQIKVREINFDWEKVSAYIKSYYPRADFEINSNVEYLKAPKLIHIMAQSTLFDDFDFFVSLDQTKKTISIIT